MTLRGGGQERERHTPDESGAVALAELHLEACLPPTIPRRGAAPPVGVTIDDARAIAATLPHSHEGAKRR